MDASHVFDLAQFDPGAFVVGAPSESSALRTTDTLMPLGTGKRLGTTRSHATIWAPPSRPAARCRDGARVASSVGVPHEDPHGQVFFHLRVVLANADWIC